MSRVPIRSGCRKTLKPVEDWKGVPEDHGDAVHGEELVVLLGRQHMEFGARQLQPQDQSLDAAGKQKNKCRHDVTNANFLVIHRRQPADHAGLGLPQGAKPMRHRRIVILCGDFGDALVRCYGHGAVLLLQR